MFQFITDCILFIYHLFFKTNSPPAALTTNEPQVSGEKYQDVRDDTISTPITEKAQERIKVQENIDKEIQFNKETLTTQKVQETPKTEFSLSSKEELTSSVKPILKESPKEVPQFINKPKETPSVVPTKEIPREFPKEIPPPPVKELQKEVPQEKSKFSPPVADLPKESPQETLKEVLLTKEINNKEVPVQNIKFQENGSKKSFDPKETSSGSEEEIEEIEESDEEELNNKKGFGQDRLTPKSKISVGQFESDDLPSGSEDEVVEDEEY